MTLNALSSSMAPSSYLLLDTAPAALAFPAARVLGITPAAEWNAETPLSLSTLIPIYFATPEPARVLRINGDTQSMTTLIRGAIRIQYVPTDALLSMPNLNHRGFELFSEIILADGWPSALVVNINVLFRVRPEIGE